MKGKIESGQLVTVIPVNRALVKGDIVLCKVNGNQYLHLVKDIKSQFADEYIYQIGNNRGGINGWIGIDNIYGICTKVEP
jgi:hypothetical protein